MRFIREVGAADGVQGVHDVARGMIAKLGEDHPIVGIDADGHVHAPAIPIDCTVDAIMATRAEAVGCDDLHAVLAWGEVAADRVVASAFGSGAGGDVGRTILAGDGGIPPTEAGQQSRS
jgi:hypothetical protein